MRHIPLWLVYLFVLGGFALCFDTPCSLRGPSSLTPAVEVWSPVHWTSKEVLRHILLLSLFFDVKIVAQKSSVTRPATPSLSSDNSTETQAVRLRTCL